MPVILADANIEGHVDYIVRIMRSADWPGFWDGLSLRLATFTELGLPENATDSEVYATCLELDMILITANRNRDGAGSLQAVIESTNLATAPPVVTLADPNQLRRSREYADRVVIAIYDLIMRLDDFRGVGRLFVP